MRQGRYCRGVSGAVAIVIALTMISGAVGTASGQIDTFELRAQVAVDSTVSVLIENSPARGASVSARVVPTGAFFAVVTDGGVLVSTRFAREASGNALGAAIALGLFPDPVDAAVALHRAGFDGPTGLLELYNRMVALAAQDAQYRNWLATAYAVSRAQGNLAGYNSIARDGYWPMYQGVAAGWRAWYQGQVQTYLSFRGEVFSAYAMPPVTADLIQAFADITAVLRGSQSPEASLWGPRIKLALDSLEVRAAPAHTLR
jgi:hypothetical protein